MVIFIDEYKFNESKFLVSDILHGLILSYLKKLKKCYFINLKYNKKGKVFVYKNNKWEIRH